MTSDSAQERLHKGSIGVTQIVAFVVAAAAPLTTVVGATPAAFALGNGVGVPGTFLIAGLMYLAFSIGCAAMGRHITNAGAFYAYVANGLGKPLGVGCAFIAIVAYNAVQVAIYGMFGFFLNDAIARHHDVNVPWWLLALACACIVHFCGARQVEFSARLLTILMLCEIAIVVLLDLAVLARGGAPNGLSAASFTPSAVSGPGLGIALVFVLGSYLGFEATAIFSEEARNPARTIARATYIAVLLITAFYAFSTWAITQAWGESRIVEQAAKDPAGLWFAQCQRLLGSFARETMNVLMLTSLFASILSFHNTISRYFYALGREEVLWKRLAHTSPRFQCPDAAGKLQTAIAIVVIVSFAASRADPFKIVFSWMSALASIGILSVQILVSLAVIAFFAKDPRDTAVTQRLIAPAISMVALAACLALVIRNLDVLSGSDSNLVVLLPAIPPVAGFLGILAAWRLKRRYPSRYHALGRAVS
jgi:amino acid transporter